MALRDFDRVRERIELRLEVRHVVQAAVGVAALLGGAFAAGYVVGRDQPAARPVMPAAVPVAVAVASPAVAPQAQVATVSEPVLPRPLVAPPPPLPDKPGEDAQIAAILARETDDKDQAPGVAPAGDQAEEQAPAEDSAPAPVAAQAPVPAEVPAPAPVAVAAQAPVPPAVPAPAAVPAAVPAPAPEARVAEAPAAPQWQPAPLKPLKSKGKPWPRLGAWRVFGAQAPAPALAEAKPPQPEAKKRIVPAAPSQPETPGTQGETPAGVAEAEAEAPKAAKVTPSRYVVQIKAFRNESEANTFLADLRAKGHQVVLTSIEVPGKGLFYRVRLGPFATLDQARAAQRKFEQGEGHTTMILAQP